MSTLEQLFTWVWQSSLFASVLVVLVLLAQTLSGKKLPARLRYWFSLAIVIRLLLPAAPESLFSLGNLIPEKVLAVEASLPAVPVSEHASFAFIGPVEKFQDRAPTIFAAVPATTSAMAFNATSIICVIWFLIAAGLSLLIGIRYHLMRRMIRRDALPVPPILIQHLRTAADAMQVHTRVGICVSNTCKMTGVFGIFRPVIILPAPLASELDARSLQHIFMHELVHIRRRDALLNLVSEILKAVHWFNPLIHLGLKRFRADREILCDALVLERLSPAERQPYGETLICLVQSLSNTKLHPGMVPMVNHKNETRRRIEMISKSRPMKTLSKLAFGLLLIALCLTTFTTALAEEGARDRPREGERRDADRERDGGQREGERREADRPDGDRPQERDRERREGEPRERDGERREGDREHRDGDRREGDRPQSDQAERHERALAQQRERERAVHQNRERAMAQQREREMAQRREREMAERRGHEQRERGEHDRPQTDRPNVAQQMEQRIRQLEEELHKRDAMLREREHMIRELQQHTAKREHARREEGGEREQQLEHRLGAMHEHMNNMQKQMEQMQRTIKELHEKR